MPFGTPNWEGDPVLGTKLGPLPSLVRQTWSPFQFGTPNWDLFPLWYAKLGPQVWGTKKGRNPVWGTKLGRGPSLGYQTGKEIQFGVPNLGGTQFGVPIWEGDPVWGTKLWRNPVWGPKLGRNPVWGTKMGTKYYTERNCIFYVQSLTYWRERAAFHRSAHYDLKWLKMAKTPENKFFRNFLRLLFYLSRSLCTHKRCQKAVFQR